MSPQANNQRMRSVQYQAGAGRGGFTLIEMLVAVTLVLIMMTMFAQIFQMAGGSISKQRGLAENDQRARTLQTIIKADLDKRSYRWVYPFAAGEDPAASQSNIGKRQGYFYISENNPYSTIDDVVQFTVVSTIMDRNKDTSRYYGQAVSLGNIFSNPNQPEADDADPSNSTGESTVAEIVYFVRNGNLYRRQLLIREPLSIAGTNSQPADYKGKDAFDPASAALISYPDPGPFWRDFDYSAYYDPVAGSAKFLGSDSLDNSGGAFNAIAAPYRRFGHYHFDSASTYLSGRPKEFASNDNSIPEFMYSIGRYTLEECSNTNFQYPQKGLPPTNFPTDPSLSLSLDPNTATVVGPDDFSLGSRRGEDLLLPNVHSFDVQVWDTTAYGGSFVNIGDPALATATLAGGASDFSMSNRLNNSYGPRLPAVEAWPTVANACFDTWHPSIDMDGAAGTDNPPFLPRKKTSATIDGVWQPNTPYSPTTTPKEIFPSNPSLQPGYPFYYRCIEGGTSASGAINEPNWPTTAGLTVRDGSVVWQAIDNRKPLRAIKIEVRFVDPSTQQMRQLTIIHSLVD